MMKPIALLTISLLVLVGCGREDVQTYQVPKEKGAEPAPAMAKAPAHQTTAAAPAPSMGFDAVLPDGWTEKPGSGMRIVSYSIEGTSLDFYLISLTMGDVPSNVNRWRGQVGLGPDTPEAIAAEVETFQAGTIDLKYIEIYNPEGGKGIIAAIMDRSPSYWYFTAKGSVDELKANAADIRAFLKSIKVQ